MKGSSPTKSAADALYDAFRAEFRRMERDPSRGPGAADQLAARVAEAIRGVLAGGGSNVSDIRRREAPQGPYARTRYARAREERPNDPPIGHPVGHPIGHSQAAAGGSLWTR